MRRRAGRFGLEVIMVNVWEHVAAAEEAVNFGNVHGLTSPLLLDDRGYMKSLGLSGVPMNVLVGADGVVLGVGFTSPEEIDQGLALFGLAPLSDL